MGVLLLGVKAYECTEEIIEFRRPSSPEAAPANIIQSGRVDGQTHNHNLIIRRYVPALVTVGFLLSSATPNVLDAIKNLFNTRVIMNPKNGLPNCET